MPKITFILKDGRQETIQAENEWSIMQVGLASGVEGIQGLCGGNMACATCHVYIHPDWMAKVAAQDNEQSEEEQDMLDTAFDVRETSRLGCQVKLNEELDGLIVAVPGTDTGW